MQRRRGLHRAAARAFRRRALRAGCLVLTYLVGIAGLGGVLFPGAAAAAGGAVAGISLSNYAMGASGVTWTFALLTTAALDSPANTGEQGQLVITEADGVSFPPVSSTSPNYQLVMTLPSGGGTALQPSLIQPSGSMLTVTLPSGSIPSGTTFAFTVGGVTNPIAAGLSDSLTMTGTNLNAPCPIGVANCTGTTKVGVFTTSPLSFAYTNPIPTASVSPATSGLPATWTVSVPGLALSGGDSITLAAYTLSATSPTDAASFPTQASDYQINGAQVAGLGVAPATVEAVGAGITAGTLGVPGVTLTLPAGASTPTGTLTITAQNTINPATSGQVFLQVQVGSSEPLAGGLTSVQLTEPTQAPAPTVSVADAAEGASGVAWTLNFTNPADLGGNSSLAGQPEIVVHDNGGATFSSSATYTVTGREPDGVAISGATVTVPASNDLVVTFPTGQAIPAGTTLTVVMNDVTNPSASQDTLTIAGLDQNAQVCPPAAGAAAACALESVTAFTAFTTPTFDFTVPTVAVTTASQQAGATTPWTVAFPSNALSAGDTITLAAWTESTASSGAPLTEPALPTQPSAYTIAWAGGQGSPAQVSATDVSTGLTLAGAPMAIPAVVLTVPSGGLPASNLRIAFEATNPGPGALYAWVQATGQAAISGSTGITLQPPSVTAAPTTATLSSYVPGAQNVAWTMKFTVTGGNLGGGAGAQPELFLRDADILQTTHCVSSPTCAQEAPGTVFPTNLQDYAVSGGGAALPAPASVSVDNSGVTLLFPQNATIPAGTDLTLSVAGVTNPVPAAASDPITIEGIDHNALVCAPAASGGATCAPQDLSVFTTSTSVTFIAPAATLSSTVSGAPGTTWTLNLPVPSMTGGTIALAGYLQAQAAASPAGFSSQAGDYQIAVPGVSSPIAPTAVAPTTLTVGGLAVAGVVLTLPANLSLPAGSITVTALDTTNPDAAGNLSLAESVDGGSPVTAQTGLGIDPTGSAVTANEVHIAQANTAPLPASSLPALPPGSGSEAFPFVDLNVTLPGCSGPQGVCLTVTAQHTHSDATLVGGVETLVVSSPTVQVAFSTSSATSFCASTGASCTITVGAVDATTGLPLPSSSVNNTMTFVLPPAGADVAFTAALTSNVPDSAQTASTPPYRISVLPIGLEQLDVLPFKIIYAPPGGGSRSSFALQQSQSSSTSYALGSDVSNSTSSETALALSEKASAAYDGIGANANAKQEWDTTDKTTTTNSTTTKTGVTFTSSEGETWTAAAPAGALDQAGVAPWRYDQFVLVPHPQFAIYDGITCPYGAAPTGAGACPNGAPQGAISYGMLGAGASMVEVSANQLYTCSLGAPLAIPGDYIPPLVLAPSECTSLLALDPFAPAPGRAASQANSPQTLNAGNSQVAVPVQTVALGVPGGGTGGPYAVSLTSSATTSVSTTQSSKFSATVDSVFSASEGGGLTAGLKGASASAGFEYTQTQGSSVTQSVTITTSNSQATTWKESATATLNDAQQPITTSIWLDGRWGTLMFQVPKASVSGVSPQSGAVGTQITIAGDGFWNGAESVLFCPVGGGPCSYGSDVNATSNLAMTAVAPADLIPGTYTVEVRDPGGTGTASCGQGASTCDQFTVTSATTGGPAVDSVTPAGGSSAGGNLVTLTGTGLAGVTQVWFGESDPSQDPATFKALQAGGAASGAAVAPAPLFRIINESKIVACAPSVPLPGPVWVAAYDAATGTWSTVTPGDEYTYSAGLPEGPCNLQNTQGAPSVASVSPTVGPANGGTTITVTGLRFKPQDVATACTLQGCAPDSTLTILPAPSVEFCPVLGGACVQGTNVEVQSGSQLSVEVPPGSGVVDVRVGNSAGFSATSLYDLFAYAAPPTCPAAGCPAVPGSLSLGASPAHAVAGLQPVTVTAEVLDSLGQPMDKQAVNFTATGAGVTSGSAQVQTDGAGIATWQLQSAAPGQVSITATVDGSTGDLLLINRTSAAFVPAPIVQGISPASGSPAGGNTVTVTGSGFSDATAVYFGYAAAAGFQVQSDTEITATAPPQAGAAAVDVTVANPAAQSGPVPTDVYTYGTPATPTATAAPAVTSVTPDAGSPAGGTQVTITGQNFTGAERVDFSGAPATSFTVNTDGTISATAPPGTGTAYVTVTTAAGSSVAVPAGQFSYLPPPTVTSLQPAGGAFQGPTTVTIAGSGFTSVGDTVMFGQVPATDVTVVSDSEILATAPPGAAPGPVAVTVTAACGSPASVNATACGSNVASPASTFTYLPLPAVTGLSPSTGPGGTQVAISGTGFTTATTVAFGTVPATSFQIDSDGQITATAPALAPGAVDVTVATACGSGASRATSCGSSATGGDDLFTETAAPAVTGVSPANGPLRAATAVTISGTGFTGATNVAFGTVSAGFRVVSGDEITATAPAATAAGAVDVTVTVCGTGGQGCATSVIRAADRFGYLPPPAVSSVSAAGSSSVAGASVTIEGAGFTTATQVDFGSTPAAGFTIDSDRQITAVLPAGAGTADVSVTTACGTPGTADATSCGTSVAGQFSYGSGPVVQALAPASGPAAGGTVVTIHGTALSGATAVLFGGTAALSFGYPQGPDGPIAAVAPPGTGTVEVTVTTANGTSSPTAAAAFSYLPLPAVTSVQIPSGPLTGGETVILGGSGFSTVSGSVYSSVYGAVYGAVMFGSVPATRITVVSGDEIVATVPAAASPGTVDVTVTAACGSGATACGTSVAAPGDRFSYLPPPVITSLSAGGGPVSGGQTVAVNGSGFTTAQEVLFGPRVATIESVTDQQITVLAPPGTPGVVDVTVITGCGGAATANATSCGASLPAALGGTFTYGSGPVVTSLSPRNGPTVGGTAVTITGSGLTGASGVMFGGTAAQGFTVLGGGAIVATAPPGSGTAEVMVTTPDGTSAPAAASLFTYLPPPAVTSVSAPSGPLAGGTTVVIGGSGFTTVADAVYFGAQRASGVTFVSDQELMATVPPSAASGTVSVTVSAACDTPATAGATACGTSAAAAGSGFGYLPLPVIDSLSTGTGALTGGEQITISGTGFRTVSRVDFGSEAATIESATDGQVTVQVPPGISGTVPVTVTTECGTAALADATSCGTSLAQASGSGTFGSLPAPRVTAVSPVAGPASGGTTVTITGTGFTTVTSVDFGGVSVSFTHDPSAIDTELTATAPPGPAGTTVDVTVTSVCGSAASATPTSCGGSGASPADHFAYLPLPAVTGVSPSAGVVGGGTTVTISGTGFTTAIGVSFGTVPATSFQVVSDQEVMAVSPAGAAGAVDVTVVTSCTGAYAQTATSCGSSTANTADQFTYYPSTVAVVTRILSPGWNTLSIPFPLAHPELSQILSDGGASLKAAYVFHDGRWRFLWLGPDNALRQPMSALYLYIGGSRDVTATLTPDIPAPSASRQPPAPQAPSQLALSPGWNLVGPSAVLGQQSYASFLYNMQDGQVSMLIDPNGADVPVYGPVGDKGDSVRNGFGYWIYVTQPGQQLVGQILTGGSPGPDNRGR